MMMNDSSTYYDSAAILWGKVIILCCQANLGVSVDISTGPICFQNLAFLGRYIPSLARNPCLSPLHISKKKLVFSSLPQEPSITLSLQMALEAMLAVKTSTSTWENVTIIVDSLVALTYPHLDRIWLVLFFFFIQDDIFLPSHIHLILLITTAYLIYRNNQTNE